MPIRGYAVRFAVRVALLVVAVAATSCDDGSRSDPSGTKAGARPLVLTTFYPTLYFVERIAGDAVAADCPVPELADPIFWRPSPEDVARYQKADLVVLNGAGFEKWVESASLPVSRVVDSAKALESTFIVFQDAVTHSHGPEGEHTHEGLDGHTWLDPLNAIEQARAIFDALARRIPDRVDAFEKGRVALERDLRVLHAELETATRSLTSPEGEVEPLLCSHPAYNYIARRYGWRIRNLDLDPEEMPGDEAFAAIRKTLEAFPAKRILWEAAPLDAIAKRFERELGVSSVVFSPCETLEKTRRDAGEDYLSVMRGNVARLAR